MEIGKMTQDIDIEILQQKQKLEELRKKKKEIIAGNTLREEASDFVSRGYAACEWLRRNDIRSFIEKSKMVGWYNETHFRIYAVNEKYHRAIWDTRFLTRICKKASNKRTVSPSCLTVEEMKDAKFYAKKTADQWEAFWLNKLTKEEENAFIYLNRRKGTTPYGWCLDHLYNNPYEAETWQEYVDKMEEFLNRIGANYSIVHYKSMVRVHVYFSSIEKMGFRNAVDLYWLASNDKYKRSMYSHYKPWTYKDVEWHVKEYFLDHNLEIKMEEKEAGSND